MPEPHAFRVSLAIAQCERARQRLVSLPAGDPRAPLCRRDLERSEAMLARRRRDHFVALAGPVPTVAEAKAAVAIPMIAPRTRALTAMADRCRRVCEAHVTSGALDARTLYDVARARVVLGLLVENGAPVVL